MRDTVIIWKSFAFLFALFIFRHVCVASHSVWCWRPHLRKQCQDSLQYSTRTAIFLRRPQNRWSIIGCLGKMLKPKEKKSSVLLVTINRNGSNGFVIIFWGNWWTDVCHAVKAICFLSEHLVLLLQHVWHHKSSHSRVMDRSYSCYIVEHAIRYLWAITNSSGVKGDICRDDLRKPLFPTFKEGGAGTTGSALCFQNASFVWEDYTRAIKC